MGQVELSEHRDKFTYSWHYSEFHSRETGSSTVALVFFCCCCLALCSLLTYWTCTCFFSGTLGHTIGLSPTDAHFLGLLVSSQCYYPGQKKKKKTATTIIHNIRTLFLSRNITRLARWRGLPRLRASLHRSAIKLDFSISNYRNSVLILCIIVVAVFFFWPE